MTEITEVLPHRYPFLFIDRVVAIEPGQWAKGYKLVSHNEWFFTGHFPQKPIMPGVLIAEAIAQIGAFAAEGTAGGVGMLSSIRDIKFLKPVLPGDILELYFEVISKKGPFLKGRGNASVDGRLVAQIGELTVYSSGKEE